MEAANKVSGNKITGNKVLKKINPEKKKQEKSLKSWKNEVSLSLFGSYLFESLSIYIYSYMVDSNSAL